MSLVYNWIVNVSTEPKSDRRAKVISNQEACSVKVSVVFEWGTTFQKRQCINLSSLEKKENFCSLTRMEKSAMLEFEEKCGIQANGAPCSESTTES